MIDVLKAWARSIKRDVVALWLAARDPRVPWYALVCEGSSGCRCRLRAQPDRSHSRRIPVVGYLDDLIIVPFGILLAVRLIPPDLMAELRSEAITRSSPTSRAGLAFIVALWVLSAALLAWAFH